MPELKSNPTYRGSYRAALATVLLAVGIPGLGIAKPASLSRSKNGPKIVKAVKKQGRDLSKGNTMYVVPYAHLDTQWRWAYPQVVREFIANTLHRNFALIDKYPSYIFNFSGSRRYEMMREYYPADYAKLKEYIKAGRWFPCGSSVDEGDANVPSAESLVRHVLYGNRYFRHEFGVASHEFMLPDCFGFPYALPTVLTHCGIKGFSTQKLTWGSAVGIPFKVGTWEGPDGKSVIAALDPGSYSGDVNEDLSQNTSWLARIQNTGKISGAYVDYHYYGTGDRGGAPNAQSVEWVEKSVHGSGPITVVSSKADEMFDDLTPSQVSALPHYKGELLLTQHSAGSISSEAYMKRSNRKSELLADAAERASVAASWLGGMSYPSDRLYSGWDLVLGSQMHDMLPGTSIPKAYEFCWNDFLLAQNKFASVEKDAVGAVTAAMDTRARGQALVVYNPLSIDREDVVEGKVSNFPSGVQVFGPNGQPVPTQVTGKENGWTKFLFLAKVPSTGFATFDARPTSSKVASGALSVSASGTLENARFKVRVNGDGDIASIYDKANRREVLKAPSRLEMQYHNPSAFPAWNMDWADAKLPPRDIVHGPAHLRVVENGPVRVALEVERETAGSKFVQTIRLSSGAAGDKVEVANKIDWQTKERALKASFPLADGNPKATYDLQVGAIERGNNDPKKYEVPQHQWLDLTGTERDYGVGILNDGKYGSDKPDDNTVRLTLIYTPGVRSGFSDQATQDFGRQETTYAIAPHKGGWQQGQVPWTAKRLNQPLRVFDVSHHAGSLGKSFSLVRVNTPQVEISALKKAEDGNEVIVRLRELDGRPASNVEVRTMSGIASAREVTGQELPVGPAAVQNGALVTNVPAFSLRAFALKLNPSPVHVAAPLSRSIPLAYDLDAVSHVANPFDGAFDAKGRSYSAEQFPSNLSIAGVDFKLGSTVDGAKNAMTAHGQSIDIPAGYSRVYLLAAADGDRTAQFSFASGGKRATHNFEIQDWNRYVGQWDNRSWSNDPGPNFSDYADMAGLTPGFVKKSEVAWYCSHRHDPSAGNTYYDYSYLFKYGFDVPRRGGKLTLPNDSRIRIFAISVGRGDHDDASPATPLYDTLSDHQVGSAPAIEPTGGTFSDETRVTVTPPLYWKAGGLHYTVDGSTPTASSPAYTGSIMLNDPTTLKVAEIGSGGIEGTMATVHLDVHDVTAPKIEEVTGASSLGVVRVRFSEEVERSSAEDLGNYKFASGASAASAKLSPDRRSVDITLDRTSSAGTSDTLTVNGVKDLAHAANVVTGQSMTIKDKGAVFSQAEYAPRTTRSVQAPGLPVKAHDPWTINLYCKVDQQPDDRTLIAGFGRARDGQAGTGRFFSKFSRGINFWIADEDVATTTPLDIGQWQMLTATFDGTTCRIYKNGDLIGSRAVDLADDTPRVSVMPLDAWERQRRFNGEVKNFTIWDQALTPAAIKRLQAMSQ